MSSRCAIDISSNLALELTTALAVCQVVDSDVSGIVSSLIREGDFNNLIEMEVHPHLYADPVQFSRDYLVVEMLRKSLNLPLKGIDPEQAAKDSFLESEKRCRETNDMFRGYGNVLPERLAPVRAWVHRIVGPLTPDQLERVGDSCRFGSGATTGVPGHASVMSDKYDKNIHMTQQLAPFYEALCGREWVQDNFERNSPPLVVEGSRFFTVPKKASTHRGAAVEPTLNSYLQLGIDAVLRESLLKFGIDLDTQVPNQTMAEFAYVRGFATIDMSSASDLIAYWVVATLFPHRWFELLCLGRCDRTFFEEKWIELEKFSSMGNGYTFAVETVIFLAVCLSVVPSEQHHSVTVYGDDIIVPQTHAGEVVELLELLGFRVNVQKTCLAGRFFESCGTDWFEGQNVRPFYLREEQDPDSKTGAPYVLQVANALRLYAKRTSTDGFCDPIWKPLWTELMSKVPKEWANCRIPSQLGDTGLITSRDETLPGALRRPMKKLACTSKGKRYFKWIGSGEEGVMVKHVQCLPKYITKDTSGVYRSRLDLLRRRRVLTPESCVETVDRAYRFSKDQYRNAQEQFYVIGSARAAARQKPSRHVHHAIRTLSDGPVFDGREPVRGLFGGLRTKWVLARSWDPGLAWGREASS